MQRNSTAIAGALVIDKPVGPTSHDVVAQLRRQLALRQVGHTGTLDPFASGVLLVAVGYATRLVEYTHDWEKIYDTTITLGATSATDDRTGHIAAQSVSAPPARAHLQSVLAHFTGTLQQRPSQYAAVKVGGKKLYEYARAGQEITAPPRTVVVHEILLQKYSYPQLHLRVRCSTGTYIRALARDIGEALATGGYVQSLRRLAIGPFVVEDAVAPESITPTTLKNHLLPPSALVPQLPQVVLAAAALVRFRQGQAIPIPQNVQGDSLCMIMDDAGRLVGIARLDSVAGALRPEKIFNETS